MAHVSSKFRVSRFGVQVETATSKSISISISPLKEPFKGNLGGPKRVDEVQSSRLDGFLGRWGLAVGIVWVAVKELNLSYHDRDTEYIVNNMVSGLW